MASSIALERSPVYLPRGGFGAQQIRRPYLSRDRAHCEHSRNPPGIGNAPGRDNRAFNRGYNLRQQGKGSSLSGQILGQEQAPVAPASRPCAMTPSTPWLSSQSASSTVVAVESTFAPQEFTRSSNSKEGRPK